MALCSLITFASRHFQTASRLFLLFIISLPFFKYIYFFSSFEHWISRFKSNGLMTRTSLQLMKFVLGNTLIHRPLSRDIATVKNAHKIEIWISRIHGNATTAGPTVLRNKRPFFCCVCVPGCSHTKNLHTNANEAEARTEHFRYNKSVQG